MAEPDKDGDVQDGVEEDTPEEVERDKREHEGPATVKTVAALIPRELG